MAKEKEEILSQSPPTEKDQENTSVAQWKKIMWITAVCVALLTFIVYIPGLQNGFINWDDDEYVYQNTHIRSINGQFISWIFQFYAANWHPVTWVSHAIDYQLWGLNPMGHHLSSILLHSLNTLLVCLLIVTIIFHAKVFSGTSLQQERSRLRFSVIVGAIAALLFGIHPIHVESVIWIAERKDVLSSFFGLLSLLFYCLFIVKQDTYRPFRYAASLFFFAVALMSKPMVVSLPFVMILLDIYPFRRLSLKKIFREHKKVFIEKIPFLMLSAGSIVVTIMAQHAGGAIRSIALQSFWDRILISVKGYIFYMMKIIVPVGLSPFYAYPEKVSIFYFDYIVPLFLFALLTGYCLYAWHKGRRLFLVVWIYYLVTLLPVIGIIQIGEQSFADRYSYMPSIALFLLVGVGIAFGIEKILMQKNHSKSAIAIVFIIIAVPVIILATLTHEQILLWKNSLTFWSYIIQKTPDNKYAYLNRANTFIARGDYKDALEDLDKVITLDPDFSSGYSNRGMVYKNIGNYKLAIRDVSEAISLDPKNAEFYNNRASIYAEQKEYQSALKDLDKAISFNPGDIGSHINRCTIYNAMGKNREAIEDCSKAIEIDPGSWLAYNQRGLSRYALNEYEKSIADFTRSLALNPQNPNIFFSRGLAYKQKGDIQEAVRDFMHAIEMNPSLLDAYIYLGVTYGQQGELQKAVDVFTKAIEVNPSYAPAYYNRGAAYYQMEKEKEAMNDMRKAAQLGDKEVQKILRSRGITW